ncbi:SUKH-4 family immunity protein [Nocardia brasiliensis]|nr:SUKH-4 family immunity protein [Nocardia brasiliensis]
MTTTRAMSNLRRLNDEMMEISLSNISNGSEVGQLTAASIRALWNGRLELVSSQSLAELDESTVDALCTMGLPIDISFAEGNYSKCTGGEMLAPILVADRQFLVFMHHSAGWVFGIEKSTHEIWAISDSMVRPELIFVNSDIVRFIAFSGCIDQTVRKSRDIFQTLPGQGLYSQMSRLIALKPLIVILEEAQQTLALWDPPALASDSWWPPEFEQWTLGIPGHGALIISID